MSKLSGLFVPDIILVDSMNLSKRYHHAISIQDSNSIPMGCPFGVLKWLHSFREKYKHCEFIFLWEGKTSFRKTLYPEYKAQRRKSSDDLFYSSVKVLQKALSFLGIKQVYYPGMEADDLAGYYCSIYKDCNILLISNDADWFQYVNKNVKLQTRKGVYGEEEAKEKFGFPPKNIPIYKALTGDTSDNIKGILRFPKKLAVHLCNSISFFEALSDRRFYYTSDFLSEKIKDKWFEAVNNNWDHIKFVYDLVRYRPDLLDGKNIRSIKTRENIHTFKLLLLKHRMKTLVKIFEGIN